MVVFWVAVKKRQIQQHIPRQMNNGPLCTNSQSGLQLHLQTYKHTQRTVFRESVKSTTKTHQETSQTCTLYVPVLYIPKKILVT